MALKIKEKGGVFFLEGPMNCETAQDFKKHLTFIMKHNEQITVDIEKVNEIDNSGLSVLREFYSNSLNQNRKFYITGYGCKEIYDDFRGNKIAV